MSAALLLLSVAVAAPPDGPAVGAPRLARGDELVYHGEAVEAGERVGNRFRKRYELEARLLVLDAKPGYADCAVLTAVRPLPDPVVAGPAALVTGDDPARHQLPPAVRLDLIRVDDRGRVKLLAPPPGPPPIPLGPTTDTRPAPPVPLDTAHVTELGMFIPLPAKPAAVGATWETADPDRPPVVWAAPRETVWNGGRCVEVTATQQTDGWNRPEVAVTGWQRTDTIRAAPADGFASTVSRKIRRREGVSDVGWVEVKYELQPPDRYVGTRFQDARREVEEAYWLLSELTSLLAKADRTDPRRFRAMLARIDSFLRSQPAPTGFRPALEAARRRCEAAARGEVAPLPAASPTTARPDPPTPGRPAPDFVAPLVHSAGQFRLSAARGGPAVLVFFKPGSKTSAPALAIAEALHRLYAGRLTVAALAVSAGAEEANRQRERMRLTVPVADGDEARTAYAVDSYPKFFVVDPSGLLAWEFDGVGPETGYLAKEEVEKLLGPGKPGATTGKSGTTWGTIRARLRLPADRPAAYDSGGGAGTGGRP